MVIKINAIVININEFFFFLPLDLLKFNSVEKM